MKNSIIVTIVCCLAAAPAFAETSSSRPEAIGVGMGATVGALAGGPVGFIVGAAVGAGLGDRYHRKGVEAAALAAELRASEVQIAALERTVRGLHAGVETQRRELERLQASGGAGVGDLLSGGIAMDLLFRTDEDALDDHMQARLGELAAVLSSMPEILVHVDGYADERGDAGYNQSLSERRAGHVRELLISAGVPESRITLVAHGESPAADERADSFALERKVSVTLRTGDGRALAANPQDRRP